MEKALQSSLSEKNKKGGYEKVSKEAIQSHLGQWFHESTLDHFWIQKRFDVFKTLATNLFHEQPRVADFGCGHGLMQVLCAEKWGWEVDGFDLDETALKRSIAAGQKKFLYNAMEQNPRFLGQYDLVILFDVLEHIEDERAFLSAILGHLKVGGVLALNVPARPWLFSAYDRAAGHHRRYTWKSLSAAVQGLPVQKIRMTEWGSPYLPLLVARKFSMPPNPDPDQVLRRGFRVGNSLVNRVLVRLGKLESIPHRYPGISLMSFCQKINES